MSPTRNTVWKLVRYRSQLGTISILPQLQKSTCFKSIIIVYSYWIQSKNLASRYQSNQLEMESIRFISFGDLWEGIMLCYMIFLLYAASLKCLFALNDKNNVNKSSLIRMLKSDICFDASLRSDTYLYQSSLIFHL